MISIIYNKSMLIIRNDKTLKNVVVLIAKQASGELKITKKDKYTLIEDQEGLVGINFFNLTDQLEAKEGAHSITDKQIQVIKTLGYEFKEIKHYFVVGNVTKREVHPKSERLFLLSVNIGSKELAIVTNSTNSLEGTNVVVAQVGATLPSGMEIVYSKVMGVPSEGMLCGGETLGLEQTEGIYVPSGKPGDNFVL